MAELPSITFSLSGGLSLALPAANYLIYYESCYYWGASASTMSILGNIALQGLTVIFDRDNNEIGFASVSEAGPHQQQKIVQSKKSQTGGARRATGSSLLSAPYARPLLTLRTDVLAFFFPSLQSSCGYSDGSPSVSMSTDSETDSSSSSSSSNTFEISTGSGSSNMRGQGKNHKSRSDGQLSSTSEGLGASEPDLLKKVSPRKVVKAGAVSRAAAGGSEGLKVYPGKPPSMLMDRYPSQKPEAMMQLRAKLTSGKSPEESASSAGQRYLLLAGMLGVGIALFAAGRAIRQRTRRQKYQLVTDFEI